MISKRDLQQLAVNYCVMVGDFLLWPKAPDCFSLVQVTASYRWSCSYVNAQETSSITDDPLAVGRGRVPLLYNKESNRCVSAALWCDLLMYM